MTSPRSALSTLAVTALFSVLASTAPATVLYWYPNAAPNQGGSETWDTTTSRWSTTSGATKTTPVSAPGASDDVIFGGTAGTVTLSGNQNVSDFQVNTANYVFMVNSVTARTLAVDTFSGSQLSSATFDTARTSGTTALTLEVKGNNATSFSGTIKDGATATMSLIKTGSGLLDISGASLTYTGAPATVNGGTLRVSTSGPTGVLNSGQIQLANGAGASGILELVGDGVSGSFSRTYSTGIRIGTTVGDLAGFSARSGEVTVNINRSSGTLVWDLTTTVANAMRVTTFQLGAASGNGTLKFTTDLQINANNLNLRSDNGSAAIDGDFAAVFTRGVSIDNNAVLNRTGDGTLRLSGNSSAFNMRLNASSGTTLVDGTLASDTANATYGINVAGGATLGGDGSITLSNAATALNVSGALMGGRGEANQSLTINANVNLLTDSVLVFGLGATSADRDQILRTGGTWSFQSTQRISLWDAGFDGSVASYALISGLAVDPNVSGWALYTSDPGIDGTFRYDAGTVYFDVNVIPEPSTGLLVLLGIGAAGLLRKRVRSVPSGFRISR